LVSTYDPTFNAAVSTALSGMVFSATDGALSSSIHGKSYDDAIRYDSCITAVRDPAHLDVVIRDVSVLGSGVDIECGVCVLCIY
jgi:hypothetical protein